MIYLAAIFLTATLPARSTSRVWFLRKLIGASAIARHACFSPASRASPSDRARSPDAPRREPTSSSTRSALSARTWRRSSSGSADRPGAGPLRAPLLGSIRLAICAAPLLASTLGPVQRAAVVGLGVTVIVLILGARISNRRRIRRRRPSAGLAVAAMVAFGLGPTLINTALGRASRARCSGPTSPIASPAGRSS